MILYWGLEYARYRFWMSYGKPLHAKGQSDVGDISIYFHRYGSGHSVLMLHGGFTFAEVWAGQIPALAGEYEVVAMDSRGHGRTTLGSLPLSFRQMAEDAAGLIERLGIEPVHLVGWSDGGTTSIALSLQRPELVRSMVLLGTPYNTSNYSKESFSRLESMLAPGSAELLGLEALYRTMSPEPYRWSEFLEEMRFMWLNLPDFTTEDLGEIRVPTLVIACGRDEFLCHEDDPLKVFRETASAIPGARLAEIPGGTHSVLMENSRSVNQIIAGFLGSVERGRRGL